MFLETVHKAGEYRAQLRSSRTQKNVMEKLCMNRFPIPNISNITL